VKRLREALPLHSAATCEGVAERTSSFLMGVAAKGWRGRKTPPDPWTEIGGKRKKEDSLGLFGEVSAPGGRGAP